MALYYYYHKGIFKSQIIFFVNSYNIYIAFHYFFSINFHRSNNIWLYEISG